jgi:purine-binding chemotaxis protein CheW
MGVAAEIEPLGTASAGGGDPRQIAQEAIESAKSRSLAQATSGEYLTFALGKEEYGIDILKVQEIRNYQAPTHIAGAPSCMKGVINLRGVIVPIMDLRLILGTSEARYDDFTVVIILGVGGRVIGAVVDSVSDVTALKSEQIRPAPEWSGTIDSQFISGLASVAQGEAERMLILMDIERLLLGSPVAA